MAISESYASPGMRHGLFKEDHPLAPQPEYTLGRGSEAGVPEAFGGKDEVCVCTLLYGPNEGIAPVISYKETKGTGKNSEEWNKLCAKALGRALKAAGYPADVYELQAKLAHRTAVAKIAALTSGVLVSEAKPAPGPDPLEAAAAPSEDYDPDDAPEPHSDPAPDPPAPEPEAPREQHSQPQLSVVDAPAEDSNGPDREAIRQELNSLNEEERAAFRRFMDEKGIEGKAEDWSEEQLVDVERWLTS